MADPTGDYVSQQQEQINKDLYRYSGRQLSSGGDKTPLVRFIGTGHSWDVQPSRFPDQAPNIIFSFEKVEVLETESEWPGNTADLEIKHSGANRSIYGFIVGDMCKALEIMQADHSLDLFIGKVWDFRREKYNWGKIKNSQTADTDGNTWGDIWRCVLHTGAAPISGPPTEPTPTGPTPVTGQESPADVALNLLNGSNKADWISKVIQVESIRSDTNLLPNIMNESWLAGLLSSGKVTLGTDGIYTVN